MAIARSLTNTFYGIRLTYLPGFNAVQLVGALLGMLLVTWLLGADDEKAEMRAEET